MAAADRGGLNPADVPLTKSEKLFRRTEPALWPLLAEGGLLIIDDYGDWAGAKKAVDQYFREVGLNPYLHRIDGTARLIIKMRK